MTEHLGYEKNSNAADNNGNSRNGQTEKTVLLKNQSTTVAIELKIDEFQPEYKGKMDFIFLF